MVVETMPSSKQEIMWPRSARVSAKPFLTGSIFTSGHPRPLGIELPGIKRLRSGLEKFLPAAKSHLRAPRDSLAVTLVGDVTSQPLSCWLDSSPDGQLPAGGSHIAAHRSRHRRPILPARPDRREHPEQSIIMTREVPCVWRNYLLIWILHQYAERVHKPGMEALLHLARSAVVTIWSVPCCSILSALLHYTKDLPDAVRGGY